MDNYYKIQNRKQGLLLRNIKRNLPELEKLLEEVNGHWVAEDLCYRYYHKSYKCFHIQEYTIKIVNTLKKLAPKEVINFNPDFEEIYKEGTGKMFKYKHNKNWTQNTRPLLEAFFHARKLLKNSVKYGRELRRTPKCLPSGWALILYFYLLR
jgi:hypothetical protein